MPQRIALRIYWQAVKLLAHGVRYCPHPRDVDNDAYLGLQENTVDTAADRTFKHREWSAPWLTAGEWCVLLVSPDSNYAARPSPTTLASASDTQPPIPRPPPLPPQGLAAGAKQQQRGVPVQRRGDDGSGDARPAAVPPTQEEAKGGRGSSDEGGRAPDINGGALDIKGHFRPRHQLPGLVRRQELEDWLLRGLLVMVFPVDVARARMLHAHAHVALCNRPADDDDPHVGRGELCIRHGALKTPGGYLRPVSRHL